jgi:hypothetical protein
LGALTAMTMLHVACSDPGAGQEDARPETIAQPLWRDITLGAPLQGSLGQPIYDANNAPAPHCVDGTHEVHEVNELTSRAAFVYEPNELRTKIEPMLGDLRFTEFDENALNKLTSPFFLNGRQSRVALLAFRVTTATQQLTHVEGGPGCGIDPTPQTLAQFMGRCGTQYLSADTRGGYVFVAFDTLDEKGLERFNNEVMTALYRQIGIGLNHTDMDGVEVLTGLLALLAQGNVGKINVLPMGFEQLTEDVREIAPDALGVLIESTWSYAHSSQPEADAPRYGRQLSQTFSVYNPALLGSCGYPDSVREEFECYQRMWAPYYNARHSDEVQRLAAQAQWLLDNSERVEWEQLDPQDPDAARKRYESFLTSVYLCTLDGRLNTDPSQRLRAREGQCQSTLLAISEPTYNLQGGELCAACSILDSCRTEDLIQEFNTLPEAYVKPPVTIPEVQQGPYFLDEPATKHTMRQSATDLFLRDARTHLCLWSGMTGKMEGSGEGFNMLRVNDEWRASVRSGRKAYAEKLTGHFHCTARANFLNGNSTATWLDPEYQADVRSTSGQRQRDLEVGVYAAALAGISGRMRGGGENAFIDSGSSSTNRSILNVTTQQGGLKAWGLSFGVKSPSNGTVLNTNVLDQDGLQNARETGVNSRDLDRKESKSSLGYQERRLAFTNEAFCYLTDARGMFDGNGESLQILRRDGAWILQTTAGCADRDGNACDQWKTVSARARCIAHQQ